MITDSNAEKPAPETKDDPAPVVRARSVPLIGLFILALLYTFYFASAFVLPIVMAVLLALVLKPLVRTLHDRLRLPEVVGSILVLFTFIGGLGIVGSFLFDPAVRWIETAPANLAEVEHKLHGLRGSLQKVGEATERVERLARQEDESESVPVVEVRSRRLRDAFLEQTPGVLFAILLTVILLYFLLASGDRFLYDVVRSLPRLEAKKRAVEISREIEHNVSNYLATITVINLGLGITVSLVLYLLKMPTPLLWGAMAGLFNFVPYLGAMLTLVVLTLVALLSFDNVLYALLIPAAFFSLNLIEAYIVTPIVVGRRLLLNPVMIFVGLMFWFWLWGIAGGLLAVPILASLKIVCDHIPSLQPVGAFLGYRDTGGVKVPAKPPEPPAPA
jgi:predicted PurR-regulated permease PerM